MKLKKLVIPVMMALGITPAYAELENCGFSTNKLCIQDPDASEVHIIADLSTVVLGDEDNHFSFVGNGRTHAAPHLNFAIHVEQGTINYMEVTNGYVSVGGYHLGPEGLTYPTFNHLNVTDTTVDMLGTAYDTEAYGDSKVYVSSNFGLGGKYEIDLDQTLVSNPDRHMATSYRGRYYDEATEIIWGYGYGDRDVWLANPKSYEAEFYDKSQQSVAAEGRSFDATFYNDSTQLVQNTAISSGAHFKDQSSQTIRAGGIAENTTLADNSSSIVARGGKMTGVTTLSENSKLTLMGSSAETVFLDGETTTLSIFANDDESRVSEVETLRGNGQITFGANEGFATLVIDNLTGSHQFNMNTALSEALSDSILIKNGKGSHRVAIKDTGKEISASEGASVDIITDESDGTDFTLVDVKGVKTTVVDGGAFVYELRKKMDGTKGIWVLEAKQEDNSIPIVPIEPSTPQTPNEPSTPQAPAVPMIANRVTSPSTDAVIAMAGAPLLILNNELENLRFRRGLVDNRDHASFTTWSRAIGGRYETRKGVDYKVEQAGLEFGVEGLFTLDNSAILMGGLVNYTDNDVKHSRGGKSSIRSFGVGAHLSFFHNNGFYFDGLMKYNRFSNKIDARSSNNFAVTANYKQNGYSAVAEVGKNIDLNNQYFLTPYGKLSYTYVSGKNFRLNNGMHADIKSQKSLRAELGVNIGKTITFANGHEFKPYLKLAVAEEFMKNRESVRINRRYNFDNNLSGTTGIIGIGMDSKVNDKFSFYGEVNYKHGSRIKAPVNVNLGVKFFF